MQLTLIFQPDPDGYSTDAANIAFAASYLDESAKQWFRPHVDLVTGTTSTFPSWASFTQALNITKKKNVSVRTSKGHDARNRPVRPVHPERAVLHLGARRKCRWILRPAAISQSSTFLLQSRKALRSCCNLEKLYVQDGIFVQFVSQRYYIVH